MTVDMQEVPRVEKTDRIDIERLGHGIVRILAHYGFMQTPNVLEVLALAVASGIQVDFEDTAYFLG